MSNVATARGAVQTTGKGVYFDCASETRCHASPFSLPSTIRLAAGVGWLKPFVAAAAGGVPQYTSILCV